MMFAAEAQRYPVSFLPLARSGYQFTKPMTKERDLWLKRPIG
jgi:hypothetical protein